MGISFSFYALTDWGDPNSLTTLGSSRIIILNTFSNRPFPFCLGLFIVFNDEIRSDAILLVAFYDRRVDIVEEF